MTTENAYIYEGVERRATLWLASSLTYFDPTAVSEDDQMFARKALVELALLVAYRIKLDPQPLDQNYRMLLEHVEHIAARPSYHEVIARDHRALLLYGLTYAALLMSGQDDPEYRWIITQAVKFRQPLIYERIPYRQLDLLHFLYIAGIEHDGPKFEDVFPFTLLAGNPNVIELDESDVYAITHSLFYITDFGFRSSAWSPRFNVDEAIELVTALTRRYRLCANADLIAELIASLICLDAPPSVEVREAWDVLYSSQQPDGRIPGPPDIVFMSEDDSKDNNAYKEWQTSYHTTIVVALAALMARRAEWDDAYPAQQRSGSDVDVQPSNELLSHCQSAIDTAAHWLYTQSQDHTIERAIRASASLTLAFLMHGRTKAEVEESVARLAKRIDFLSSETDNLSWASLGADTMLLAAYGMRYFAIPIPHVLEREIQTLATHVTTEQLIAYPAILSACILMVHLGKLDRSVVERALESIPLFCSIPSPEESGPAFANRLLHLTGGNPTRLGWTTEERHKVAEWLTVELTHAYEKYGLGDIAVIIRALALIGYRQDRVTKDAVAYLLSQQRSNGAFGYFANDSAGEEATSVHVNWTSGVLWALLDFAYPELSPTRLFSLEGIP